MAVGLCITILAGCAGLKAAIAGTCARAGALESEDLSFVKHLHGCIYRQRLSILAALHTDKPGHPPDQLRQRYPDAEFEFTKPGVAGQDVTVVGGKHPSEYPGSSWPRGVDFGDTPGGLKTFLADQRNKWIDPNNRLPYDPNTGDLK